MKEQGSKEKQKTYYGRVREREIKKRTCFVIP